MASTSHISPESTGTQQVQDDDELWTKYLDLAGPIDERVVKEWEKITDVFLVYIALFAGVITAFGVDSIRAFQPDPGDVTNLILIAIYKETMNKTYPIDLEKYLTLDKNTEKKVYRRNLLLFLSLAFAIVIGTLAIIFKIWIIRYARKLNHPPPGSRRLHALNRQELYDGSRSWKLGTFIELLPILTLIDVLLFALFIIDLLGSKNKTLGNIVPNVFQLAFFYFSVASFSGAFIPNAPFQSSYSTITEFVFNILPNNRFNLMGKHFIYLRTIGILLVGALGIIGTGYLVPHVDTDYLVLLYIPTAAVFALMGKGEKKDVRRRFNLPFCIFALVSCVYGLYISAALNYLHPMRFYIIFGAASALFLVVGFTLVRMSGIEPSSTAVNAVAWILKTSPSPDPIWFQKAVQIAGKSQNLQVQLLELLLPLAEPLIIQIPEDGTQGATPLQKEYLKSLERLTNSLLPREVKFLRNEAPIPSKFLRRELENLKNVECPSKRVGVGDFRHYRKCPLCYIQRVAEVALERFDDKPGEQAPDWGGDRGGDGEAETRQETSIAMDSRHSPTSRPSGSSNFVSCTGASDHAPV